MDAALLELLRCPDQHHAELAYDAAAQTLTCTVCTRVYAIRDGIPIMLIDEATGGPETASGGTGKAAGE